MEEHSEKISDLSNLSGEKLPEESHYRNLDSIFESGASQRPTLEELYSPNPPIKKAVQIAIPDNETPSPPAQQATKFGWIKGVLMPCLLNIWGVMLFLRLPWVTAQSGILLGLALILLCNVVTIITAISLSAIATNGAVEAGGIYYMISRSLGPQFGAPVGLMFTIANSIASATYVIGFVNSLQDMFLAYFDLNEIIPGAGGGIADVRMIGIVTLILLLILAVIGLGWVVKLQIFLLILLLVAQGDLIVGVIHGPSSIAEQSQGFVGFNWNVLVANLWPDYRYFNNPQSFFSVFGVFFPAVTGVVAGANLSGDLKKPSSAIPKGTLLAILITLITYLTYPILIGASVLRDATGNETEYALTKSLYKDPTLNPMFNTEQNNGSCYVDGNGKSLCNYGMHNNFQVVELVSETGVLIYIGCFAATLSSAIGSLVGSAKVLQALAKDNLIAGLHIFAKGYGVNNEPLRGYGIASIISCVCILSGDLNKISNILTNFFLASYALINFACFHASLMNSPGFRPSFKYYHRYLSLLGIGTCVVIMFVIDITMACVTACLSLVLFIYVGYRNKGEKAVNWGTSVQVQNLYGTIKTGVEMENMEEHVKIYIPKILVMSGIPCHRPALIAFAHSITKKKSYLACATVLKNTISHATSNQIRKVIRRWFTKHEIQSYHTVSDATTRREGARSLYRIVGNGKLRPNVIMMGYKSNWQTSTSFDLKEYFSMILEAFDWNLAVVILRVKDGFDYSQELEEGLLIENILDNIATPAENNNISRMRDSSVERTSTGSAENLSTKLHELFKGVNGTRLPDNVLRSVGQFHCKQPAGFIDVWWLFDDGGLTVLLPYMLTARSRWNNCKLRIFAVGDQNGLTATQIKISNLMKKFRIEYEALVSIDLGKPAADEHRSFFDSIISDYQTRKVPSNEHDDPLTTITETDLESEKIKTNRHIRLRELLLQYSKDSSLVVMTLPMIRKSAANAPLYMAWLECITQDMPPCLLVRGNQESVLTTEL